jgi:hypothetical protein
MGRTRLAEPLMETLIRNKISLPLLLREIVPTVVSTFMMTALP